MDWTTRWRKNGELARVLARYSHAKFRYHQRMNKALMAELEKLGPDERLRLAYDLLESVAQAEATGPVTQTQRAELRRRLTEYRANPTEPVVTLADIRREFSDS
jgi:putative addiction module component (TIGR02574 family)